MAQFALVHSPLVGPSTWKLTTAQLQQHGHQVIVPTLVDSEADARAYWEQHAQSAAQAINATIMGGSCILVGHSGAGPILPAIGERLTRPPGGYIFVDAGLPNNRASRLDLMKSESSEWAREFERHLTAGECYPNWSDTDLQSLIPDNELRQQMLREIKARTLAFFAEQILVPEDWSITPCGYIQFTEAYAVPASRAKQLHWPFIEFQAAHFHMLVEPIMVADALVQIGHQLFASA